MRDPRDMVFVFASMGAGIASGLRAHTAAIAGTVLFCLAAVLLASSEFGSKRQFDGLLRFQIPLTSENQDVVNLLKKYTRKFVLVTLREVAQGEAMEHAYQVRFGAPRSRVELIRALESLPGAKDVSLMLQEPTVEL